LRKLERTCTQHRRTALKSSIRVTDHPGLDLACVDRKEEQSSREPERGEERSSAVREGGAERYSTRPWPQSSRSFSDLVAEGEKSKAQGGAKQSGG
jgi:hypothetical protein